LCAMSDSFECEIMSWELFEKLAMNVAKSIRQDGFQPDFMVGLARGGWVLSRVLCDFLGVKDLVSLIDLTGKNVLVVDDITDTGESMLVAVEYVKSKNPASIKTAALRHIDGSKFTPDYYGDVISWRWVVFPWNFVEDMCNLVPKASEDTNSLDEIKKRMKERFNVDLSTEQIESINEELKRRK